jgi:hypothetical protein
MFSHSYFESRGSGGAAGFAPLSLIAVLKLYLTDFLKCTFLGEIVKNRAFCGGQKLKAVSLYHPAINPGALNLKLVVRLLHHAVGRRRLVSVRFQEHRDTG